MLYKSDADFSVSLAGGEGAVRAGDGGPRAVEGGSHGVRQAGQPGPGRHQVPQHHPQPAAGGLQRYAALASIIGRSCHKCNFHCDKTCLLSRQKYACRDKTGFMQVSWLHAGQLLSLRSASFMRSGDY